MTPHTEYDAALDPISYPEGLCPDCGHECRSEEECKYNRAAKFWLVWADKVDPGVDVAREAMGQVSPWEKGAPF